MKQQHHRIRKAGSQGGEADARCWRARASRPLSSTGGGPRSSGVRTPLNHPADGDRRDARSSQPHARIGRALERRHESRPRPPRPHRLSRAPALGTTGRQPENPTDPRRSTRGHTADCHRARRRPRRQRLRHPRTPPQRPPSNACHLHSKRSTSCPRARTRPHHAGTRIVRRHAGGNHAWPRPGPRRRDRAVQAHRGARRTSTETRTTGTTATPSPPAPTLRGAAWRAIRVLRLLTIEVFGH